MVGRPEAKFALVLVAAVAALAAALQLGSRQPTSVAERAREVASTLRCPVCQNLSVADSPSPLARQMRASIRRDLLAGRSPGHIRSRFVDAYGEWILLEPQAKGVGLAAWIAPAALLILGLGVAAMAIRRWTQGERGNRGEAAQEPELAPEDRRLLEAALGAPGEDSE